MPFNGIGGFTLVAGNPVVTGTTISSTVQNNTMTDFANGFANCVTRDGQSAATANIPMGGFKLTGLAAGTANGDAVRWEQLNLKVSTADLADPSSASNGDALVGAYDPYATAYLKNLSQIRNGERYNLLNAVPIAQRAAIQAYTSTYDALADINDVISDMDTAKRGDLYVSDGLYNVSAAITYSRYMKMSGPARRGFGGPGSTGRGAMFKATGSTGALVLSLGALATVDVLIEHINFIGSASGTPSGILINLACGVTIRDCVVSGFGGHNIATSGTGTYGLNCERVYSAQAGATYANFYVTAEKSFLKYCESDGGGYGIQSTSTANDLQIDGGVFEGSQLWIASLAGRNTTIKRPKFNSTYNGASGLQLTATAAHAGVSVDIFGHQNVDSTPYGIDIAAGCTEYALMGCHVVNCATAARLSEGAGNLVGGIYEGATTGIELVGGTYVGYIGGGALISGATDSIKHTSGTNKWIIGDVNLRDDDNTTYKDITITAGAPLILDRFPTNSFAVTYSASMTFDASTAGTFLMVVTNGTAMTVNAPTNPSIGQTIELCFSNTSGGAMGAVTFNAVFKVQAFTGPATGFRKSIFVKYDGTSWYQKGQTGDVPN